MKRKVWMPVLGGVSGLLKPCPHCGSELQEVTEFWAVHPKADCYLSEWEFDGFNLDAWNERPVEKALRKRLERYEKALRKTAESRYKLTRLHRCDARVLLEAAINRSEDVLAGEDGDG